jgi:hypothetical protein
MGKNFIGKVAKVILERGDQALQIDTDDQGRTFSQGVHKSDSAATNRLVAENIELGPRAASHEEENNE